MFKSQRSHLLINGTFSFNSEYFAISQSNRILVYKNSNNKEWINLGNYISHSKDIVSLHFGEPSGMDATNVRKFPRLISVGKDNLMQEYNLKRSNPAIGIRLKSSTYLHTPNAVQQNDKSDQNSNVMFTCCHIIPGIRFPSNVNAIVEKNIKDTGNKQPSAQNSHAKLGLKFDQDQNSSTRRGMPISSLKFNKTSKSNKNRSSKKNIKNKENDDSTNESQNDNENVTTNKNKNNNNHNKHNVQQLWQTFQANSDQIEPKFDDTMQEWNNIEDIVLIADDELKLHYYHCFKRGASLIKQRYIHGNSDNLNDNNNNGDDTHSIHSMNNNTAGTNKLGSGYNNNNNNNDDESVSAAGSASFGLAQDMLDAMVFRRKLLGPAFGSPVRCIKRIETPNINNNVTNIQNANENANNQNDTKIQFVNQKQLLTYCTYDQIIGLMKWPLDGTQHCYYAVNAHPAIVSGFAVSYDHNYVITCGGQDRCIILWKINHSFVNQTPTNQSNQLSALEMKTKTFISMLDPANSSSQMYQDIKNYFYYVQIKKHREISNSAIKISKEIGWQQVESIMQALGFFLSGNDMIQIKQEIAYRFGKSQSLKHARSIMNDINNINNTDGKNFNVPSINLNQFIELFINYRPTYDISVNVISKVFQTLRDLEKRKTKAESAMRKQAFLLTQGTNDTKNNTKGNNANSDNNNNNNSNDQQASDDESSHIHPSSISRSFLLDVLQKKGEKMTREELLTCFEQLTGYPRKQLQKLIPDQINVDFLATKLLGLEVQE